MAKREVNPPQHMPEQPALEDEPVLTGVPTGTGTADTALDVADPHPADEEHYDRQRHPGGTRPPKQDLGANDAIHDGTPPRRPHNAGSGPE